MRRVVAAGDDAVGRRLRKRPHDRVEAAIGGEHARAHRGRVGRVDQAAFRRGDVYGPLDALVERDVGAGQRRLHRRQRCRDRRGERAVQVARHLRTGAGIVDRDLVAADRDLRAHRQWRIADTVVVDQVLALVVAVRDLGHGGPEAALGIVDQLGHGARDLADAVAAAELDDALGTDCIGGELGVEVADRLVGRADVRGDQALEIAAVPVALDIVDRRREDQPLGVHVAAFGVRPGLPPPRSRWCDTEPAKPTSSPSTKIGE